MPVLNMNATTLLIKTNTLYDAALTPNIGLEVGLGKGWSIAGNVMYGWWSDRSKFYWRAFATDIGVRKYFGSGHKDKLSGHHLGLYAGMMTWDFELGGRGYICDFREEWGRYFGIDYGYSLPVAKNLNIDFALGLGYAGGRYKIARSEPGMIVNDFREKGRIPNEKEISLLCISQCSSKIVYRYVYGMNVAYLKFDKHPAQPQQSN